MINGDGGDEHYIKDGCRTASNCPFSAYSDERWYFWKFTWSSTRGRLEVREDSPNRPDHLQHQRDHERARVPARCRM